VICDAESCWSTVHITLHGVPSTSSGAFLATLWRPALGSPRRVAPARRALLY